MKKYQYLDITARGKGCAKVQVPSPAPYFPVTLWRWTKVRHELTVPRGVSQLARQMLIDRFVSSELPLKVRSPLQRNAKEILKSFLSFLITCVETLNKC